MALYVQTNVSSINAQRKLTNATNSLNVSYQRLASGLRINSSKDDAAGLQISDRLTSQINGLNQGNRNANDGIALAQTIEGAMDETTNMLQRIRVLAVQAANGTNTKSDRKALQEEVTQLCAEITRISKKTTFAQAQVLDGVPEDATKNNLIGLDGKITFQVGANANDTLALSLSNGFSMTGMVVSVYNNANPPANKITKASEVSAKIGKDPAEVTKYGGLYNSAGAGTDGIIRFSISTADFAQATLGSIDQFIQVIDSARAGLGALQNRMESTIRNQASISENESDARSRIRDTDFAAETAALTQNNIIQQASQTILSQANQRPTIALNLLGQ